MASTISAAELKEFADRHSANAYADDAVFTFASPLRDSDKPVEQPGVPTAARYEYTTRQLLAAHEAKRQPATAAAAPAKRGRGRPRKTEATQPAESAEASDSE